MAPNTIETLRLLVVSSEPSILRLLGSTAQSNSWHLETSSSGWDAMERVQSGAAPHLLLLDIPRGDGDGLHLLPWLRRLRPDLPIVVLCDPEDADRQKEATRLGAKMSWSGRSRDHKSNPLSAGILLRRMMIGSGDGERRY